jgi:hypothetical protein
MIVKSERRMRTSLRCGSLLALGLGLGLALTPSCASAPPPPLAPVLPPSEEAQVYYPLEPGWIWAYDVDRAGEHILAVTSVQRRGAHDATLQAGGETLRYDVGPAGIARVAGVPDEADKRWSNDFLIKNPVRRGASWPIDGGTATITDFGRSVTVAAGTFRNCVVVEESRSAPARVVRTTYAPGVGPVALESLVQMPGKGAYETTLRASLRGVTRPGEDPLE